MENLKKNVIIGCVVSLIGFIVGIASKSFFNEGTTYDVGWKSWDITANVLSNGDMEVSEKLVYFDDYFYENHVSESLISFSKSTRSNVDINDTSSLKENSFYVSVYDSNKTYFDNQNTPSSNAFDSRKYADSLGFSWVNGCLDERGHAVRGDRKSVV